MSRRERWEHVLEWPLTAMAVAFLVAYAVPILNTHVNPRPYDAVVTLSWVVFAVDYAVRLGLSEQRARFVREHPLDALVVALPVLRPLRLIRLLALLSVLNRYAEGGALRGRIVIYLVGSSSLLIFIASLTVLDAERGAPGANIEDFGDAAWWSITTMTTVGYGDRFPVTGTGRFVAVALMIAGIALLGTVTATLATYLIDRIKEVEDDNQTATRADMHALMAEVKALREQVSRLERS